MAHPPYAPAWTDVPSEAFSLIASFLTTNEITCHVKLINKAARDLFRDSTKINLSQPVPQHTFAGRWGSPDSTRDMTLKQRRRLLVLTARSGVLANLQLALAAAGCTLDQEVFSGAAASGSLEVCQWLLDMGCPVCSRKALESAAKEGHLDVVRWLRQLIQQEHEEGSFDHQVWRSHAKAAMVAAAGAGQREMCEALLTAEGVAVSLQAVSAALRGGHITLVEWLIQHALQLEPLPPRGPGRDASYICVITAAAISADLSLMQRLWRSLLGPGAPGNIEDCGMVLAAAIASPTPDWQEKLAWLEAQPGLGPPGQVRPRFTDACVHVLMNLEQRAVERLELLRQRGAFLDEGQRLILHASITSSNEFAAAWIWKEQIYTYFDKELPELAAMDGDLKMLMLLHSLHCHYNRNVAENAARYGHLHVLEWLAGPCSIPGGKGALRAAKQRLTLYAAASGNIEVVRWVRGRGYNWAQHTASSAAASGNAALLEMLAADGCPLQDHEPYLAAAQYGDLATLACLRRLGCPWDGSGRTLSAAIQRRCPLEALRWFHAAGCPVDWRHAWQAARDLEQQLDERAAREMRAWLEGEMRLAGYQPESAGARAGRGSRRQR